MVLLLPPAPAARVLLGLALAAFSLISAAARRRMTARAPPGGTGVDGPVDEGDRPVALPTLGLPASPPDGGGESARGEDYDICQYLWKHETRIDDVWLFWRRAPRGRRLGSVFAGFVTHGARTIIRLVW